MLLGKEGQKCCRGTLFGLVLSLALSLLVVLSFLFGHPLASTASFFLKSASVLVDSLQIPAMNRARC